MEYLLQLEEKQRYWLLAIGVSLAFIFILFSSVFMGLYGIALSVGLLFFTLIAPLLYGRHKLFLFIWIFIVPVIELQRQFLINDLNPFTYLITGITFPVAFILFYKELNTVLKELPFLKYIILLEFLVICNFFRPDTGFQDFFYAFRFHFIEIFIIFTSYFYFKKNSADTIFKWINIFALINAVTAIFERVTGFGLVLIEGLPRVGALVGHPNTYSLLINIYMPIGMYLLTKAKSKREKIFYSISLIINAFALVLTLCKASLFIFALSLLILFFYMPYKIKFRMIIASVLFLGLFLIVNYAANLNIIDHIIQRLNDSTSFTWRIYHWKKILTGITPLSFFIGNGIGSLERYSAFVNPNQLSASHNLYIELLFTYGILGLLYYLNIFILAIKFLKASLSKILINRHIYLVPFLVLTAILLDAISDTAGSNRVNIYMTWIIITAFYMQLKSDTQSSITG